jgi:dephospho-CoA kinase
MLAKMIFNDISLLNKVNLLIHPVVSESFIKWVGVQEAPYAIMEAAILFESGTSKLMDKIATVTAPAEERVNRVIHRSNLSKEQVLERMRNQMEDEKMIELSEYVISNSEKDMIIPAILKIHEDILKLNNRVN